MVNKILIVINTLALVIIGYWLYVTREPEPLSAFVIGIGTLIGFFIKEKNDSRKTTVKQNVEKNNNSPNAGNIENQTINYNHTDPLLSKRIEEIESQLKEGKTTKLNFDINSIENEDLSIKSNIIYSENVLVKVAQSISRKDYKFQFAKDTSGYFLLWLSSIYISIGSYLDKELNVNEVAELLLEINRPSISDETKPLLPKEYFHTTQEMLSDLHAFDIVQTHIIDGKRFYIKTPLGKQLFLYLRRNNYF